jgi:O-acetyl-ADP-ribose deacetylase (regulator of RNase III)
LPKWQDGVHNEALHLHKCYENAFKIIEAQGFQKVAIQALGVNMEGYPFERTVHIALECISDYLEAVNEPVEVQLVFGSANSFKQAQQIEEKHFS